MKQPEVDDTKLIQEIQRATLAKQVAENPVWIGAWSEYEGNLRAHMEDPAVSDEMVMEARRMLLVVRRVRRDLETVMETGQLAEIELERIRDAK